MTNITNYTGNIMDIGYNLTNIVSPDIINDPPKWIANFNNELGGIVAITFLMVLAIVLFLVMRKGEEVQDSEAAVYAGVIVSLIAIVLFLVDVTALPGVKIVSWAQVLPFLVITGIALLVNHTNRRW